MKNLSRSLTLFCALVLALVLSISFAQQQGGTMIIGTSATPNTLNPAFQSGTATGTPGTQIFATPLRFDENWNPQPYLAESWDVAEDGLTVTLNLVDNAVFHDGADITSEDVEFSILTVQKCHPFKTMFGPVTSVDTPDAHTVVINLSQPHPAILLAMSSALLPILPKHIYDFDMEAEDCTEIRENPLSNAPIGSGPFKFVEFVAGESITLERFDDFFLGAPYLDGMIFKIFRDSNAQILSLQRGEIHMIPFMTNTRDIDRLTKADTVDVTNQGYAGIGPINWLAYNTKHEILQDVRVRQAIAYAIDRDFIVNALHSGFSTPAYTPITASNPMAYEGIERYDVDLDKANALLDEAGYPMDGDSRFSLTVDYIPGAGSSEQQKAVAEYLKSQLPEIGIEIEVRASPDFPTWSQRVSNYDFELSMDILFNWGDPVIGVHRTYLSSNIRPGVIWSNTQQYENAEVDEILDKASQALTDEERKGHYDAFQKIVGEELPVYWINAMPYHTAYTTSLQNPPVTIWGPMSPMNEIWLDDSN